MSKITRQELEQAGFQFHPGYIDGSQFVFTAENTTADLSDLLVSDWQLVTGGIMAPPKPNFKKVAVGFALIGAALFGVCTLLERRG